MPLRLIEAEDEHRPVIDRLVQLYLHDVSEFAGIEPDDCGLFALDAPAEFWTEETTTPLLILLRGKPAGFALVNSHLDKQGHCHWRVDDLFVVRGYRRLGIGEEVARMIFDLYEGQWHVKVSEENDVGIAFWRQVLRRYTLRKFREIRSRDSKFLVFEFVSPTPDPIPRV